MLWSLIIFAGSLVIVLAAGYFIRRKPPEVPAELLRPPPPDGFANLSGAEYELIEWELRVEPPPPLPEDAGSIAPPPE